MIENKSEIDFGLFAVSCFSCFVKAETITTACKISNCLYPSGSQTLYLLAL